MIGKGLWKRTHKLSQSGSELDAALEKVEDLTVSAEDINNAVTQRLTATTVQYYTERDDTGTLSGQKNLISSIDKSIGSDAYYCQILPPGQIFLAGAEVGSLLSDGTVTLSLGQDADLGPVCLKVLGSAYYTEKIVIHFTAGYVPCMYAGNGLYIGQAYSAAFGFCQLICAYDADTRNLTITLDVIVE